MKSPCDGRRGATLERLFELRARNSSARTEILAGITIFPTMAYIVFVNPKILACRHG